MTLGNSKQNCSWQYRTMSKFEVFEVYMAKQMYYFFLNVV